MSTIDELREALHYVEPPASPDTARIIALGRRRRRRRRTVATCVASAVALVTVAGIALTGAGPKGGAPVGGPPSGPRPSAAHTPAPRMAGAEPNPVLVAAYTAVPPAQAPTRFDPLRRTLHVGWIPDRLPRELSVIEPFFQLYSAATADEKAGMVVIVLPRGRPLSAMPSAQRFMPEYPFDLTYVDTAPINGRRAQCVVVPPTYRTTAVDPATIASCPTIQWQYAPDAWARASYAAPPGTTGEKADAQIRELAESVSLAAAEPVRLPFTISGGRPGRYVAGTMVSTGGGTSGMWNGSVSFVDRKADLTRLLYTGPQINVQAYRVDPTADPGHTALTVPNSTVDGHPAWVQRDGSAVVLFPKADLRVLFEYFERSGDARTGVSTVHLVPAPDSVATWVPLD